MTRETITNPLGRRAARTACAAALIAACAVMSACGSSSRTGGGGNGGSSSTPGMSSSGSMVDIKNFSFTPMTLTISVGTTVTWKFDDSALHTVSAGDKSFLSPAMSNGQTYTHTFTTAGTYKYICSIHQYMTGTIVVK